MVSTPRVDLTSRCGAKGMRGTDANALKEVTCKVAILEQAFVTFSKGGLKIVGCIQK